MSTIESVSAAPSPAGSRSSSERQVRVLLVTVFVAFLGQMTLNPTIAPLATQMGLEPWQIGATISTAAAMVVLTSQAWGRASQSRGRKAILVAALGLAVLAMAGFGLYLAFGSVQLVVGFLIQDRYQLQASAAGAFTGAAMLVAGLAMVLTQAVAVPRLKSAPVGLLRYGALA